MKVLSILFYRVVIFSLLSLYLPKLFADLTSTPKFDETATSLRDIMISNLDNNLNPKIVRVADELYEPNGNWGVELWHDLIIFQSGDLILDNTNDLNPRILELNHKVKGGYNGGSYLDGDHVFYDGLWFVAFGDANYSHIPANPNNLSQFQQFTPYNWGDAIRGDGNYTLLASHKMKGMWSSYKEYQAGDVVFDFSYKQLNSSHLGAWHSSLSVSIGETVSFNGFLYKNINGINSLSDPSLSPSSWQLLGHSGDVPSSATDVSTAVQNEANGSTGGTYFELSPWRAFDSAGTPIGNPLQSGAFTDQTIFYTNINSIKWRLFTQNTGSGKPVVSNVLYSQRINSEGNRTKLVDINYDLEGNRSMLIEFFFSYDGGITFPVVCNSVTGDAGSNISSGLGKTAVWDAGQDWDRNFTNRGRIMIKASY